MGHRAIILRTRRIVHAARLCPQRPLHPAPSWHILPHLASALGLARPLGFMKQPPRSGPLPQHSVSSLLQNSLQRVSSLVYMCFPNVTAATGEETCVLFTGFIPAQHASQIPPIRRGLETVC